MPLLNDFVDQPCIEQQLCQRFSRQSNTLNAIKAFDSGRLHSTRVSIGP